MRISFSLFAFVALVFGTCANGNSTPQQENPPTLVTVPSLEELQSDSMISFSTSLDNLYYFSPRPGSSYFYAEAKAAKYESEPGKRTPLNLALVIDRSGSMGGDKLKYAKEAAKFVVDNVSASDFLSIVIYDDQIETIFQTGHVSDKNAVKRLIDQVTARGTTNLCGGMLQGYDQVLSSFKQGYVNRVLLLSDGLANVGIIEPSKINEIVRKRNQENGITISTFGVGADFNEDMMLGIAENGSGNYYFIKSPDEIPEIFQKELKGLLSVVAQNMELTITLPHGLNVTKVYGYQFQQTGQNLVIKFRDVFSEETKAVLVKFEVGEPKRGQYAFAATLTYDDVVRTMQRKKLTRENTLLQVSDSVRYKQSMIIDVHKQIALFESNERLELAMRAIDEGHYAEARRMVNENNVMIKKYIANGINSEEIMQQDSTNSDYSNKIKDAETMPDYDKKMMQKSSKSMNYMLKSKKITPKEKAP